MSVLGHAVSHIWPTSRFTHACESHVILYRIPVLLSMYLMLLQGLSAPFEEQYSKLQRNVVLAFVASSAGCLVAGFFLGKHFGSGKKG